MNKTIPGDMLPNKSLKPSKPEYFIAFLAVILSLAAFKQEMQAVKVVLYFNTNLYTLGIVFVTLLLAAAYLYALEDSITSIKTMPRVSMVLNLLASWLYFVAIIFPLLIGVAIGISHLLLLRLTTERSIHNTNTVTTVIVNVIAALSGGLGAMGVVTGKRSFKMSRVAVISLAIITTVIASLTAIVAYSLKK